MPQNVVQPSAPQCDYHSAAWVYAGEHLSGRGPKTTSDLQVVRRHGVRDQRHGIHALGDLQSNLSGSGLVPVTCQLQ